MENTMISWFNNCKSNNPQSISLKDWLTVDAAKLVVEEIRKTHDKEKRRQLKTNLPAATLSGLFSIRKQEGLIRHSGYICIDIDGGDNQHINNFEELRTQLGRIVNVAYSGLSVGGRGVFCLIPIKYPEKHKQHFQSLIFDFESIGIKIDKSCGDITRLRIISYDENAVFNNSPIEYEKTSVNKGDYIKSITPKVSSKIKNSINFNGRRSVENLIKTIQESQIDITGSYNQWFQIGCALANEFGEDGRAHFHTISQHSEKYHEGITDQQFNKCLENKYSYKIGTFFHYATENGISLK